MARPKTKENKAVTVRMDATLVDRLDSFCEESGQSKTLAIERAVERYIDDYDKKMQLLANLESQETTEEEGRQ